MLWGTYSNVLLNIEFTINSRILEQTNPSVAQNLRGSQKAEFCFKNAGGLLKFFIQQESLEFVLIGQDQAESFHFSFPLRVYLFVIILKR